MNDEASKERSLRDRAARGIRNLTEAARSGVSEAAGTITGKQIEDKLTEYSELYTQVLLGIHKDVQGQSTTVGELASSSQALETRIAALEGSGENTHITVQELETRTQVLEARLRTARVIILGVFAIAVVALGGLLWQLI